MLGDDDDVLNEFEAHSIDVIAAVNQLSQVPAPKNYLAESPEPPAIFSSHSINLIGNNITETTTPLNQLPKQADATLNSCYVESAFTTSTKVLKIQTLNAPIGFSIETHSLNSFMDSTSEEFCIEPTTVSAAAAECTQKADIDYTRNLNMASISRDQNDYHHVDENETELVIENLNPQECFQVDLDMIDNDSIDFKSSLSRTSSHRSSELSISRQLIQNTAASNCVGAEECVDLFVPIEMEHEQSRLKLVVQEGLADSSLQIFKPSVFKKPSVELISDDTATELISDDTDSLQIVDEGVEEERLTNKQPDKQLLLWLNYPHLRTHMLDELGDETRSLDEKLDYLYERVRAAKCGELPASDTNLVHIEKVLSLFISNQEKIEHDYELIQALPYTRPELQSLIHREQLDDMPDRIVITPEPVKLVQAKQQVSEEFRAAEFIGQMDYAKIESLLRSASNEYDSIEQLSKITDENKRILTESKVVFNLPSIGKLAQLDETTTEFYDHVMKENVCEETVELICLETLLDLIDQATSSASPNSTRASSPDDEQLNHSFEKIWEMDPKADMLAIIQDSSPRTDPKFNQAFIEQQPIEWEQLDCDIDSLDHEQIKEPQIVPQSLLKTAVQQEMQLGDNYEIIKQSDQDWSTNIQSTECLFGYDELNHLDNIRKINFYEDDEEDEQEAPVDSLTCTKESGSGGYLNACEKFSQKMNDSSLNGDEDELGSFIEQIEKYELISNVSGRLDNISECRTEFILNEDMKSMGNDFVIEKEKLDKLVDQMRLPDADVTLTNLNESLNDADSSMAESEGSSKIHLIESVEIVTHHNQEDQLPQHLTVNEPHVSIDAALLHIHKVDINRLQIREKKKSHMRQINNETSNTNMSHMNRFRVDFKQEEVIDLRDFEASAEPNECIELKTDKIFAKKFVEQIIQLNSSKLTSLNNQKDVEAPPMPSNKYESIHFNRISGKSSMEILASLSNIRTDIGKHLTESLCHKPDTASPIANNMKMANDLYEINEFLMQERSSNMDLSENCNQDDDQDSLHGCFFDTFEAHSEHLDQNTAIAITIERDQGASSQRPMNTFNGDDKLKYTTYVVSPTTSIVLQSKDQMPSVRQHQVRHIYRYKT